MNQQREWQPVTSKEEEKADAYPKSQALTIFSALDAG